MKKIKNILLIMLFAFNLAGCSHQQPAFTFNLNEVSSDVSPKVWRLERNPQSAISVESGKIVQLSMDNAYLAQLYDKKAIKEGYSGRREVLIYAIVYKDGIFQKFSKITDLANNMASYQPVVVQKPNFFTETIDGSFYQIVIKAFEVDTEGLVRILRRAQNTDITKIASGSSPYAPGATFVSGFKTAILGVFDMILSVTGKSVDDWIEQIAADKVFEHSIYIVPESIGNPGLAIKAGGEQKLVLIASGDERVKTGKVGVPIWTEPQFNDIAGCQSILNETIVVEAPSVISDKECLKIADYRIAEYTKNRMAAIEKPEISIDHLSKGALASYITELNDVSHLILTAKVK